MTPRQEALVELADSFRARLTQASVAAWEKHLEDWPDAVVIPALTRACRDFQRFPSIAQVRDLCGAELAEQREKEHRKNKTYRQDRVQREPDVAWKRAFLERAAEGRRRTPISRALANDYAWQNACRAAAQHTLDTLTDEDLEQTGMWKLVSLCLPGKKIGAMP